VNDDRLKKLLLDADSPSAASADPAELAFRVRRRLQRRRRNVRGAGGLMLLAAALMVVWHPWHGVPTATNTPPLSPLQVAALRQDIDRLHADADARQAVVDEVLRRQAVRRMPAGERDPFVAVRIELERSSMIALEYGQRLEQIDGQAQQARAQYYRVMELFPESRGALLARQRLGLLNLGNSTKDEVKS
jgi:hypothetical protein